MRSAGSLIALKSFSHWARSSGVIVSVLEMYAEGPWMDSRWRHFGTSILRSGGDWLFGLSSVLGRQVLIVCSGSVVAQCVTLMHGVGGSIPAALQTFFMTRVAFCGCHCAVTSVKCDCA